MQDSCHFFFIYDIDSYKSTHICKNRARQITGSPAVLPAPLGAPATLRLHIYFRQHFEIPLALFYIFLIIFCYSNENYFVKFFAGMTIDLLEGRNKRGYMDKQFLQTELQDYQDIAVLAFSEAGNATSQEQYEDAMREWRSACERIKEINLLLKVLE